MGTVTPDPWVAAGVGDVSRRARAWLWSDELIALVGELGGPARSEQWPAEVRAWSATVLDTRAGAERHEAHAVNRFDARLGALLAAAAPLGLLATAPASAPAYDAVVVLAGTVTGNRLRTALAHETLRDVSAGTLVALASDRALSASETAEEPGSAADLDESQNLLRCVERAFGALDVADDAREGRARDLRCSTRTGLRVRLLVAPPAGARRPTTAQQLQFLLERMPLAERRTALLVTSAIYAPYQFFAGAPVVLADGADHVEVIGTPTFATGDPARLAQRVAQEIHAAIHAAASIAGA